MLYRQYIQGVQTVYTGCTDSIYRVYRQYIQGVSKINYRIVPVTSFNKYLQYGASGHEEYVYKYRCNWRQLKIMIKYCDFR
jgi:hypothetical protein